MRRRDFLGAVPAAVMGAHAQQQPVTNRPNIILIYGDDVGWGDLGCYGARSIRTPNLDRLAQRGIRFTDAHSSSATCTPSRYALMTGEYPWRRPGTAVLPGNANLIIEPGRPTLASTLQKAEYVTGCVGKWHLGLGKGEVDWNKEIRPGPIDVGFDYSFIIPATGDRVPCVYVENQRVANLDPSDPIRVSYSDPVGNEPTGRDHPEMLKQKLHHGHDNTIVNGISRIGYMTGGHAARWVDEDMADVLTRKAVTFIERHSRQPFFLYFGSHDIHVPRVPHRRFSGKAACGFRCDAMQQLDWCVGEIQRTLEKLKLANNTLIVFSSDNGPVLNDGYLDGAVERLGSHRPAGPWRGGKYSNFEGGTRVPFIASWPARIKPGVSDALVSQLDLMSSFAALTGSSLPAGASPDGQNMLPALLGESKTGRDHLVEHASALSLRVGQWKLISPNKGPAVQKNTNTETGNAPEAQLYDLSADPGETKNLAHSQPARAKDMLNHLEKLRSGPRAARA